MIHFSVVIATYNRKDLLRRCLTAVLLQDYPHYDVIVVDDASNDGTPDLIKQQFPNILYLQQKVNRGPAAARNRGIFASVGSIIAFTDDDCLVPTNWLSQLAQAFIENPQVVGVGGFQEAPTNEIKNNPIAKAEHIGRLWRLGNRAHSQQLGGYEVPGFGTNNVAYQRQVLLECNGFDETFPVAAGEDADLKLRITQKGYQLLYLPLKVEHLHEYSWSTQWRMAKRRGVGVYYFETKHSQPPSVGLIALRFMKRTFRFIVSLFRVRWDIAVIMYMTSVANTFGQLQTNLQFRKTIH